MQECPSGELRPLLHFGGGCGENEGPLLGRQPRFPIVAASCLWKCKAFDANGSLRASLRTHTIGRRLPVGAGASKQPFADLPIFSIVCFGRILGTAAPGRGCVKTWKLPKRKNFLH